MTLVVSPRLATALLGTWFFAASACTSASPTGVPTSSADGGAVAPVPASAPPAEASSVASAESVASTPARPLAPQLPGAPFVANGVPAMKDGFCKTDPPCWKDHLDRWKALLDAPPEPRFVAEKVGLPRGVTSDGWRLHVVFPEPPTTSDRAAIRFDIEGNPPSYSSHAVHDAGPFVATVVFESAKVRAGRVELRISGRERKELARIPLELATAK